jgi:hypothetical protein
MAPGAKPVSAKKTAKPSGGKSRTGSKGGMTTRADTASGKPSRGRGSGGTGHADRRR